MTPEEMEQLLRKEAQELVKTEPLSKLMLEEQVLNRKNFADMYALVLERWLPVASPPSSR